MAKKSAYLMKMTPQQRNQYGNIVSATFSKFNNGDFATFRTAPKHKKDLRGKHLSHTLESKASHLKVYSYSWNPDGSKSRTYPTSETRKKIRASLARKLGKDVVASMWNSNYTDEHSRSKKAA